MGRIVKYSDEGGRPSDHSRRKKHDASYGSTICVCQSFGNVSVVCWFWAVFAECGGRFGRKVERKIRSCICTLRECHVKVRGS